ncbi:hypothetical protein GCM10010530_84360 [Kribbella aluminosa]
MTTERCEVTRRVAADTATIFAVLCSPHGHVAIDASGMLQSAEGSPVERVGDEFLVHMDRESLNDKPLGRYDIRVVITRFERDRRIEWMVSGSGEPPRLRHAFGYLLEPSAECTLVTSYHDWSEIADEVRAKRNFPVISEATLRATLGILARTVEQR